MPSLDDASCHCRWTVTSSRGRLRVSQTLGIMAMQSRRDFLLKSSAALAVLPLSACTGPSAQDYDKSTAEVRGVLADRPNMRALLGYAALAANGHNTQPWRFRVGKSQIRILPDFTRRTPAVDPDNHHLFVSLGCAAENLLIAAAMHGRSGALAVTAAGEIDIDLIEGTQRANTLYRAIPLRQSTRSIYDGRSISNQAFRQLALAARVEGVSVRIFTTQVEKEAILERVIAGNTAQMDDPAFVNELLYWIRFNPSEALLARDGLYAPCSGNPTLPTWIGKRMFTFAFNKQSENDKYVKQIRSSAGIAVFIGDHADYEHWIRVGRSFQRFALQATALGLRHAHVNQPVEVPQVRTDFARWLGLGDVRPDLVVRFGWAAPLPMSMRRSIDVVIDA